MITQSTTFPDSLDQPLGRAASLGSLCNDEHTFLNFSLWECVSLLSNPQG